MRSIENIPAFTLGCETLANYPSWLRNMYEDRSSAVTWCQATLLCLQTCISRSVIRLTRLQLMILIFRVQSLQKSTIFFLKKTVCMQCHGRKFEVSVAVGVQAS